MLTSKQILSRLDRNKARIDHLGVDRIGLFGSYARDEQKDSSDIDILVSFKQGEERYSNLFELHEFLVEILGTNVEIVTMGGLSPYIGPHILKEVKFIETT